MNAPPELLRSTLPTVARIAVTVPEGHPSVAILGSERFGTATVVEPDGLLVTANYFLLGGSSIEVTLADGRTFAGERLAQDFTTGIGVLRIPASGLPYARMSSSAGSVVGEEVFLVASVADSTPRATTGAISCLGSFDAFWEYSLPRAILSTAMSPGLGGGAMFDRFARMIGIVSLNPNEVGRLSLAIPIENYVDRRGQLLSTQSVTPRTPRAWLGLYCDAIDNHVIVLGVIPGAPAQSAGLRPGDLVVSVDGVRIEGRRQLYEAIWRHRAGEKVAMEVFRDEETESIEIESVAAEEMFR